MTVEHFFLIVTNLAGNEHFKEASILINPYLSNLADFMHMEIWPASPGYRLWVCVMRMKELLLSILFNKSAFCILDQYWGIMSVTHGIISYNSYNDSCWRNARIFLSSLHPIEIQIIATQTITQYLFDSRNTTNLAIVSTSFTTYFNMYMQQMHSNITQDVIAMVSFQIALHH